MRAAARRDDVATEARGRVARRAHRDVQVDIEHGRILQSARAGAMLETDAKGTEIRVLRDLPDNEWICFGPNGILGASEQASGAI